jgi:hypothetical protein
MGKTFKIPREQLRDLARGHGGCLATDLITVEGQRVGFMYREESHRDVDSGWRFMAGGESDEYMGDADKHGVYDVNTIANYDPDIIPFLDAPVGSAFERSEGGQLVQVEFPPPSEGEEQAKAFPVVEGKQQMTDEWAITLPGAFKRRLEDDSLVFWRPGLTAWIIVWDKDADELPSERLAKLRQDISDAAFDLEEDSTGGLLRLRYRLREEGSQAKAAAFYSFVVGVAGHVQMAIYFDDEVDVELARAMWRSLEEDLSRTFTRTT